ncbi:MAG: carboxymuconolactone decarboxylase family protein [Hyphomicrobiaceae bacterium]
MARIDLPDDNKLTPQQRAARDEVVAGKRGKIPAPMIAWLRNPELARRTQALGELLRYDTTLDLRLVELAILVCARHWTANVQWSAHKTYALQAGLDPAIIAAIAANSDPPFIDAGEATVYAVCKSLLAARRIPDELYSEATSRLGEQGVVELVVLLGYYCIASFTLNTFEIGLPGSVAAELEDPEFSLPRRSV